MKTTTRNAKTLPPVTGTVKLLQAIGDVAIATGEIAINGKPYLIRVRDHSYELFGFDARRNDVTTYEVPATLDSCDCPDFANRAARRADGLCKHCKALAALVNAGKLPRLECNPIGRVDDLADDLADDYDGAAEAEAEAWHSQYDAA